MKYADEYFKKIKLNELSFDAIIFDCDGTLVNTAPAHYKAFNCALHEQGAVMKKDWYAERLAMSRQELLTEFQKFSKIILNIDQAVNSAEQHYLLLASHVEAIEAAAALVERYYKVVPMAVASSGQRASVEASLTSAGLLEKFEYIITASDVINHKPHPEVFLWLLNCFEKNLKNVL